MTGRWTKRPQQSQSTLGSGGLDHGSCSSIALEISEIICLRKQSGFFQYPTCTVQDRYTNHLTREWSQATLQIRNKREEKQYYKEDWKEVWQITHSPCRLIMAMPGDPQTKSCMKSQEGGTTRPIHLNSHTVWVQVTEARPIKLTATHLFPESVLVLIIAPAIRQLREVHRVQL
jgi:hypothetical protein